MRTPWLKLALAAVAINLIPAPAAHAQGIPDRLADSTFWRMVTQFSEPSGYFQSENFVSNEQEWQYIIPRALKRVSPGGVYLGVGPEQNFTYIAAFQPRIAFICDIRRQNMIQHLMYKALIEMSADRADLLLHLWSRPRPAGLDSASSPAMLERAFDVSLRDSALFRRNLDAMLASLVDRHGFALSHQDSVTLRTVFTVFFVAGPSINYASGSGGIRFPGLGDTSGIFRVLPSYVPLGTGYATFGSLMLEDDGAGVNRGWLGSEQAFRWLKDFEARNLLVPVVGDFAGPKALRAVGEYLKANGARVSTFYVSNVEQYLFQSGDNWQTFYRNVSMLPTDSSSMFIRSVTSRFQVAPVRRTSRMAQLTSSIDEVVRAFLELRLASYSDLIALRDR